MLWTGRAAARYRGILAELSFRVQREIDMRRPESRLVMLLAVLPLAACTPSEPPVDTQAEAQIVMALERDWASRFQQGDIDWIVNRHATHGRILPPGSEAAVGREAVREVWTGFHETEGLSLDFGPDEAHVAEAGDMAYVLGSYDLTLPDGGEDRGKYLVVWVKEDGEWRIAADMFNSSVAPPAEAVPAQSAEEAPDDYEPPAEDGPDGDGEGE